MAMRNLGITVASLGLWALGPSGPKRALEKADAAGFNGLQVLPLRGWNQESMKSIPPLKVISYEGAWNQGTLMGVFLRMAHPKDETKPKPEDWLMFGAHPLEAYQIGEVFPNALRIVHKPEEAWMGAYEVNPEGGLPKAGQRTVFDTLHAFRGNRDGSSSSVTRWMSYLPTSIRYTACVHVHPKVEDINDPLNAEGALAGLVRELARITPSSVPFILEVAPDPFAGKAATISRLAHFRSPIRFLIGN